MDDLTTLEDANLVNIFRKIFQRLDVLEAQAAGNSGSGGGGVGARVHKAAVQSTGHNSSDTLTFDTEDFDDSSFHDGSNPTRLTAPSDGWYIVSGNVAWAGNTTGRRIAGITHSAAGAIANQRGLAAYGSGFGDLNLNVSTPYYFTAGQYATLTSFQDSGGSLDVTANFTMVKVG